MASATFVDAFHFDTNQFLNDTEVSAIDYDDLFGAMLGPPGPGSSGAGTPAQQSDSAGAVASPAHSQDVQQPVAAYPPAPTQPQPQPQAKKADVKSMRDATKRVRDTSGNKGKSNQVKELEALAAQKGEELERLVRQNNELKFRQQMLERVVQLQDHQLKVMRGASEELPQPWCSLPQPAAAQQAAAGSGAAAQPEWQARGASAAASVRQMGPGCLLACHDVILPAVDRERFRSLGKQKMMDGWKHFLSEVSVPLLTLEASPDDEGAAARLRQLAAEAAFLVKHASLLAPDTVMQVTQTQLETEAISSPDPAHWRTVARTLELAPEQVAELTAVWSLFQGIIASVLRERRAINARLADGAHGSLAEAMAALSQLSISAECEVMQSLQRNLRREKSAHLLLRAYLFGRSLSVLQFVKAAVYAYPWFPDATAIVAAVAEAEAKADGDQ